MTTKPESPSEALARIDDTVKEIARRLREQADDIYTLCSIVETLVRLSIEPDANAKVETFRREHGSFPIIFRK